MVDLFKPRGDPRPNVAQRRLFDIRQIPSTQPQMTPEQRYPRGYTPGRMREVRTATDALIDMPQYGEPVESGKEPCPTCGGLGHSPSFKVTPEHLRNQDTLDFWKQRGIQHNGTIASAPGQQCWGCGGKGSRPAVIDSGRRMGLTVDHPFYEPHGARLMQESIARSTIPTEHLQGLAGISLQPERKVGRAGMGGTLGLYTGKRSRGTGQVRLLPVVAQTPKRGPHKGERMIESLDKPSRDIMGGKLPREMVPKHNPRQLQQAETTLIHEIGHHVSEAPAGGMEEARADRYMMEHWRPDPRDVKTGREINPFHFTYLARMGPAGRYSREELAEAGVPEPKPKGRRKKAP